MFRVGEPTVSVCPVTVTVSSDPRSAAKARIAAIPSALSSVAAVG